MNWPYLDVNAKKYPILMMIIIIIIVVFASVSLETYCFANGRRFFKQLQSDIYTTSAPHTYVMTIFTISDKADPINQIWIITH